MPPLFRLFAVGMALSVTQSLLAQDSPPAAVAAPALFTPSEASQQFLTDLVREALPAKYEKTKNWGHTRRVLDGWSFEQHGLKIETRRRWKEANDGIWQKYDMRLVDADDTFHVRLENMQQLPDGRVAFDMAADARLAATGRQSHWESGVLLYSVSAEADARVRLTAHVEAAVKLDPTRLPPDVYLEPVVTAADMQIPDFRLRKVSQLHGPLVRSLSHSVREALEEKLSADRKKLVAKLNKQIAKHENKLKFSASELIGKFPMTNSQ